MNLISHNSSRLPMRAQRTGDCRGMTLIETLVALGVGALVLTVVAVLSVYALRSFTAMGNYADLEARSRTALDRITRDLRQATGVDNFDPGGSWLRLTTAVEGVRLEYFWDAEERELVCLKDGQVAHVYLTECDEWSFALYQRTPRPGLTNLFHPTTDKHMCKMIEMNWKCSRTMLGKKWNTESAQSVRIVLRNKS